MEPGDLDFLFPKAPPSLANLKEFDFIEYWTGQSNLTHYWNKFGLRHEVVERVLDRPQVAH